MDDFESQSKQNRQRLLTGNSKALVEEEKFRKTSKRKYETVTEKMSLVISSIQLLGVEQHINGVTVDVSQLSQHLTPQGLDILNGKMQEKIELMHLYTSTHGKKSVNEEILLSVDCEKEKEKAQKVPGRSAAASASGTFKLAAQTKISSSISGSAENRVKPSKLPGPGAAMQSRINGENIPNRSHLRSNKSSV
jgi:hypothetical protein